MKREHIVLSSDMIIPSSVPYQDELILYAPLYQNDLRDYVTGKTLIFDNGCSAGWDSSNNAYQFELLNYSIATNRGCYWATMENVFDRNSSAEIEYTAIIDSYAISFTNGDELALLKYQDSNWTLELLYQSGHSYSDNLNTWYRRVTIKQVGSSTPICYKNGVQYTTQKANILSGNKDLFLISKPSWFKGSVGYLCLKNAIFYKKALTLQEAMSITI